MDEVVRANNLGGKGATPALMLTRGREGDENEDTRRGQGGLEPRGREDKED